MQQIRWLGWPSYQQYLEARKRYSTLTPKLYRDQLVGFTVDMPGIVGGGSKSKMTYRLYISLVNCPAQPPEAWVISPKDSQICHRNIWHSGSGSHQINLGLPLICLGDFVVKWIQGRLGRATNFVSFLDQVYFALNNENPRSPAR